VPLKSGSCCVFLAELKRSSAIGPTQSGRRQGGVLGGRAIGVFTNREADVEVVVGVGSPNALGYQCEC
jgi:hypothetical protein